MTACNSMRCLSPSAFFAAMLVAATSAQASVEISSESTQNMNCTGGVCSPTAKKAVLNATDLANMLSNGSVKVKSGNKAKDIEIDALVSWTSANKLTLDACRSIIVNGPVEVTGTGDLVLKSNGCSNGGDTTFATTGHIEFWDTSSNLVVNSTIFKLKNGISEVASAIASDPSGNYALARSYDASIDGTYGDAPIPTTFTGNFEGLGNVISKLTIDDSADSASVGLFAHVGVGGVVRDTVLQQASVSAEGATTKVGAFVGLNEGTIHADRSDAITTATATASVGGLAGYSNQGVVEYSTASGSVKGGLYAGGLVGFSSGAYIYRSSASSTVDAPNGIAGGLVGWIQGFSGKHGIESSSATGKVTAGGEFVGGLVGYLADTAYDSFATGNVTGGDGAAVGGFAGIQTGSRLTHNYARGAVSGGMNANVGGLLGQNYQDAILSYSTGAVSGGAGSHVGGLVGSGSAVIYTDCYWDTETSGTNQATGNGGHVGIAGLTTSQFKSGLPDGFDPRTWREKGKINNGYPYLLANPPPQ